MANQLLTSLLYQPSSNIDSNRDIYDGSVSCTRFYLNALAEAEGVNYNVHTIGFDVDQIWIQSQVLLEAIRESAYLPRMVETDTDRGPPKKRARRDETIQAKESTGPEYDEDTEVDHKLPQSTGDSSSESGSSEVEANHGALSHDDLTPTHTQAKFRGRAPNELDDGFFSIDAFNLETEKFERADEVGQSLGGLDTTINWNADPDDDVHSSGPDSDSPDDTDRTLMYKDFFLPPEYPESRGGVGDGDASAPRPPDEEIGSFDGIGGVMNEIERDLFDDLPSDQHSAVSWTSEGMDHSSHRNTQTRLSDHIRELEKQNIDRREWTLSGEANSKQRPFNSLLQEDLDFERIGKPVPVVTQESTTTLEEMIKGRIVAGRFDEILRRSLGHHEKSRRSAVELEDSKSKIGLAEVYEQEHLEKTTSSQSKGADVKLDALRFEISSLFSTLSNQLDMLSSWHFTPKTPQSTLSVVQDVRTLDMEEVQVNANHLSGSRSTALAPQEVYNPSSKEHQGDGVVKISGIPMSLSEVERSRRTKQKSRKNREVSDPSRTRTRADENIGILKSLQRADVAVIDRDGKQVSLGGSRPEKASSSGSRIKL